MFIIKVYDANNIWAGCAASIPISDVRRLAYWRRSTYRHFCEHWSFVITIYELLTGSPPGFKQTSGQSIDLATDRNEEDRYPLRDYIS